MLENGAFRFSQLILPLVPHILGQTITSCPGGDSRNLCTNSDYQGDSAHAFSNVPTLNQCAQIGQQYRHLGYSKAVCDQQNSNCYVKANTDLDWVVNNGQFDTVRPATEAPTDVNRGQWSGPTKLPLAPAGAFVIPDQPVSNRVMGFSSWSTDYFGGSGGVKTQFTYHNWQTGEISEREVSNTQHDMFCPGMSFLTDGRMVITGGETAPATSVYDHRTDNWTSLAEMTVGRGYQSSTMLSNGNIFTIGGSFTGGIGNQDVPYKNGEVYGPATNIWTALPGADVRSMLTQYDHEGAWRTDNHAWLFAWKSGSVFQAGPSRTMNWYTTSGQGAVVGAGTRDLNNDAMCGVNVMYDAVAGKIFSAGGSQSYKDDPAFTKGFLITIGEVNQPAQVEAIPDAGYARGVGNIVVLPNGQVVITGGQLETVLFTDDKSVFNAELWDPTTKQYTTLAPGAVGRNYHSMSLLLADGRIWVGGGGLCYQGGFCPANAEHFDFEIFTPPYLINLDGSEKLRPNISSLSSDSDSSGYTVRVGGTLTATLDENTGATFSMLRIGSATHSINTDQRRIPLANVNQGNSGYTIQLPGDAGILLPGHYYLFAMDDAGVPCVARTVQVLL